jgi:imidazolonepropionase-like amidohydrolase
MARGRFRLFKFQQPVGEETFEFDRIGGEQRLRTEFAFTDRGERVPLRAELRLSDPFEPRFFEVEGRNARQSTLGESVRWVDDRVVVERAGSTDRYPAPPVAFPISGYAPVAIQAALLRYWQTHGTPAALPTFPARTVRILRRGRTAIDRARSWTRFAIEGLIWGREWVWLDDEGDLAALVSTDAEADHFEAVRDGEEHVLGRCIADAGADGMEALHALSNALGGTRAPLLALVHGRLVDGGDGPAVPEATVIVRGERIEAVGPADRIPIPPGAELLDAGGRTILPGLWDLHAHFQQVEWGPIYLAAGVTTVRDCGNEFEFLTSVRDAIAAGRGLGPRILAAGIVDGDGPYAVGVARVRTPEEAEAWVGRYSAAGFQQIKVYSSMSREALSAVAAEAHRRGMTVTGHVPIGLTALEAVDAGMDQLSHIVLVAPALVDGLPPRPTAAQLRTALADLDLTTPTARAALAHLRARGTVVDPTLALLELYTFSSEKPAAAFEPGADRVAAEIAGRIRHPPPASEETRLMERVFRRCVEIVGAMHRIGIPIVAGTDQAVPGHSLHREIELYVEAGFTPREAIQSATSLPARLLGLGADSGTIAAGRRADLVIVDGDPLGRIRDLRRIHRVVAAGVVHRPAPLWGSVGFDPAPAQDPGAR